MVGEGRPLAYDARGRAIFKSSPGIGNHTLQGLLRMVTAEGVKSYPFSSEYQVGASQTVISPTRMNVLYIGADNTISISMSGVPMERIQASISQGTITRTGNEWIAKPTSSGTARITASGTVDGRTVSQSMEFRVRMVPTPIAKVGGRAGGPIDKNTLVASGGVNAELEDFLFDMRYGVTQFNVMAITTAGERSAAATSPAFTDQQKQLINSLTKGQRVMVTGIKARGPDGVKDLRDIIFTIN
jgi:gliding motility-associated protein GldM